MKCLLIDGKKKVSFQERKIEQVGPKDVLVKLKSRGICGTDLNSYRTGMPMGFGHEMAGVIEQVGEASEFTIGSKVFVSNLSQHLVSYAPEAPFAYLGGFADYILVREAVKNVDLYPVCESMSYSETALIEPFCVGMSGAKKYPVTPDSHVVILGAGIIGMCAFEYLKSQKVKEIVVVDINEHRLAKAKHAGAIPFNSQEGNLKDFLTEQFGTAFSMTAGMVPNVDVYIDAAGVGSLLNDVINMAKHQAQVTILAVYHQPVHLNMATVMYNNVKVVGSCMFDSGDILEAIEIISQDSSIGKTLISHEIPFENAIEAFRIADDASISLKVMMVD